MGPEGRTRADTRLRQRRHNKRPLRAKATRQQPAPEHNLENISKGKGRGLEVGRFRNCGGICKWMNFRMMGNPPLDDFEESSHLKKGLLNAPLLKAGL